MSVTKTITFPNNATRATLLSSRGASEPVLDPSLISEFKSLECPFKLKFQKPSSVFSDLHDPPTITIMLFGRTNMRTSAVQESPENDVKTARTIAFLGDGSGTYSIAA